MVRKMGTNSNNEFCATIVSFNARVVLSTILVTGRDSRTKKYARYFEATAIIEPVCMSSRNI